jgi:hypothetical protein
MSLGIEHVAGPYVDLLQHCTRCGSVLSDYRNAAWPSGTPAPRGWEEGARVYVTGWSSSVISEGPVVGRLCEPSRG